MPENSDHDIMHPISVTDVRGDLAEIVNRAHYAKSRITVTRRGKGIAAIVPMEDLHLLLEIEAKLDLDKAREALASADAEGTDKWDAMKKELGL